MRKLLLGVFLGVVLFCIGSVYAAPVTIIQQGDEWDYAVLPPELWGGGIACWTCPGTWASVGYDYVDWNSLSYSPANAAFGNPFGLPYSTYWEPDTDLALRKFFSIDGIINGVLTLNVASDNGFMAFINGQQVAKEYAGGYTSYWEYTFSIDRSLFVQGLNIIEILAADHGGATFFDLELNADITPVPEPATILLLGSGVIGLLIILKSSTKMHRIDP